ncbi:hypothetical protein PFISCL1PPCAC_10207 [Pristionchus fissidentatus]|uniref:Uncharacterized protein n=1 Tax=Pristionchus fissidentatus TaxID=1538716 RepID=A0AAV5VJV6_9BILA|nr:hypothetical protein PFISCL1PPCAC_10207 [Pristionchus fissidentatus]
MLGAQALRTKQKAEQKEKEKRHRERLQSVQLEREKMHRIAREDMNELAHETSLLHLRDQSEPRRGSGSIKNHSRSPSRSEDLSLPPPHRHRHSIHNVNLLQPVNPKRRSLRLNDGPQRSTSSDYCRVVEKKESGNRFMRWLGFSSSSNADKEKEKRRMSTY